MGVWYLMPFKPGKAPKDVAKNYRKVVSNITGVRTKATLTKIVSAGLTASKEIAPIEYGTLINSGFRGVEKSGDGWRGFAGYAVNYAAYLNGTDTYTPLWKPRPPEEKDGPGFNHLATPKFLNLGFEGIEARKVIQQIIEQGYKLK